MLNYIEVFTGNFIQIQRIFNELSLLNVCAIIRDKSKIERLNSSRNSNQISQKILVHKDELKRAKKIIKRLTLKLQN